MTGASHESTPVVRHAELKDISAIEVLWQEMMDFHIKNDWRLKIRPTARESYIRYVKGTLMKSPGHFIVVAELQGKIVGYLTGRIENTEPVYVVSYFGHITDISVTESARRHGVGKALFAYAEMWFKTLGLHTIRLSVAVTNPVSRAFWQGVGFQPFFERYWYDINSE